MSENKHTIKIYYSSKINDISQIYDLLWGIEEEGIPYEIKSIDNESAISSSYKAAQDSRLDVGLGISDDGGAVLHYLKLKENSPLFHIDFKNRKEQLRALGANAARLVKGSPFKIISNIE